jgi:leucyl aminopeptidase (aminopeptidase T)
LNSEKKDNLYVQGAMNLIKSLELDNNDGLIVMSNENNQDYCSYILDAARELGIKNNIYIIIPESCRPMEYLPEILLETIKDAQGLIFISTRKVEEDFTFNRPIQDWCIKNQVKYAYTWDAKPNYLKEGIAADYQAVDKKTKQIKEILENSVSLRVTSDIGTDLSFSVYTQNIIPRSPLFPKDRFWNQAPEGEVMSCPVEKTFNGTLVVDGVVTGLGQVPSPIEWKFKDGRVVDVKGDAQFLERLFNRIKRSDKRLNDLKGIWIAEFSVGSNDWAVFDDNISNCEKVSGGVHFAMGNSEGLGVDRGETFHFDNIVKAPSIIINNKEGEQFTLIKSGKLMI